MNRKELALKCLQIEAEGGSVREFLKTLGSSEDIEKAPDECGIEDSIKNAVEYGGFEVIVLRSPCTGFRYTNDQQAGKMTWHTNFGNTVGLTAEEWHNMAAELPKVLQIFGI